MGGVETAAHSVYPVRSVAVPELPGSNLCRKPPLISWDMRVMQGFSYAAAFARNIGWITEWEQDSLRGKRVAIAGLGGVGGQHLLTLARLGVGAFSLADFDSFDYVNFNRQAGATIGSVGRAKLDVMAEMALAINPELRLSRFPEGVTTGNVDDFLAGVDLFVDGLDFFVIGIRRTVFRRCAELGIPAITAAPIGMGTNWIIFVPGGMSFEDYFRLEGQPETEQYLRFLIGLAPKGVHRGYLVDPSRVDLKRKIGPSTGASCQLCSGVVGVEAVKLLLRRNNVRPAPTHHHFDPYAGTHQRMRLRWGVSGPVLRLKLAVARRFYLRQLGGSGPPAASRGPATPIEHILTLARWAPSGDNAQPWRFDIVDDERIVIHFTNESGTNPYEYRGGQPSLLSLGMLIETIRLAASAHGRGLEYTLREAGEGLRVDVRLAAVDGLVVDPLEPFIAARSVDRRAMNTRPIAPHEKVALQQALGPEWTLSWFESRGERWRIARLSARATDIRLRAPEFFPVHQRVIDWEQRHSPGGLPAGSIGLDPATLRIMRWATQKWQRVHLLNRLTGTFATAAQIDLLPGMRSAGYIALAPVDGGSALDPDTTIRAGGAIQRLWLTATKFGLALQPATALLMTAHYGESGTAFTADKSLLKKARDVAQISAELFGHPADDFLFIARIGQPVPRLPTARSVRHPLEYLKAIKAAPLGA